MATDVWLLLVVAFSCGFRFMSMVFCMLLNMSMNFSMNISVSISKECLYEYFDEYFYDYFSFEILDPSPLCSDSPPSYSTDSDLFLDILPLIVAD